MVTFLCIEKINDYIRLGVNTNIYKYLLQKYVQFAQLEMHIKIKNIVCHDEINKLYN